MKKIILVILSLIIGLVSVVWLYQHVGLKGIFSQIGNLNIRQLVVIFIFQLLAFIIITIRWKILLKDLKIQQISFGAAFKTRLTEYACSYFFPFYLGTEIVRPGILKTEKGVSFTVCLASVIIDRLAEIAAIFIFLFFGAVLLLITGNIFFSLLILFLVGLFFFLFLLLIKKIGLDKTLSFFVKIFGLRRFKFFPPGDDSIGDKINPLRCFFYKLLPRSLRNISISDKIDSLGLEINDYLKRRQSKFPLAICLSCLTLFIWLFQAWILLGFFGYHLALEKVLLIKVFVSIASLIPIPARLGTYEAAHVLIFNLFGLSAKTGIAFTLIIRLMDFIIVALGIFFGAHYLIKFFYRKIINAGISANKL